jgi:2,5-diketo-D-gluconate reductase A
MTETLATAVADLSDGFRMPLLGLGTWRSEGDGAYESVRHALDIGYRHLDTAKAYGNEDQVGRAIKDSGIDRDELFVTTKLPPNDAGREAEVIEESLRLLGLDHLDLWLIHWPPNKSATPEAWQGFIAARDSGRTRSIGVSNYSIAQIDELAEQTGVTPSVNQVPWSPLRHDQSVLDAHTERGIVLEGYSPLRHGTLEDPTIVAIGGERDVSPAQVILRWHIEKRIVAIPKSVTPSRIEANADIFGFSLSADEVARLDALGR